jgi:hypothetical protein
MGSALAAACGLLALVVNIATYFTDDLLGIPLKFPHWAWLFVSMFVFFIPACAIQSRKEKGARSKADAFRDSPRWVRIVIGCLFAFTLLNFAAFIFLMRHGSATRINGEPTLASHGHVYAHITEDEFRRYEAYEVRGATGHIALFNAVSAGLLFPHRRKPLTGTGPNAEAPRRQG